MQEEGEQKITFKRSGAELVCYFEKKGDDVSGLREY